MGVIFDSSVSVELGIVLIVKNESALVLSLSCLEVALLSSTWILVVSSGRPIRMRASRLES